MAQVLTDDDELDLEDEQRKKQQQDTIGKPIAYGPMPKGEVPPSTPTTNQPAPEIGAASPSAQTVSGAAPYNPQPPAPRPESQAFTDWQAQDLAKHPAGQSRYHGLARVADTIAQMTWPGQAAEIGGEFGTLGAKAKANRLAGGAAQENTQIGYGEHERQANALEQEQEARAKTEETGGELQTMPSGLKVMTKNVAPIVAADVKGNNNLDVQGLKNEGSLDKQEQIDNSPLSKAKANLANAQADLAKFRANPNSPMYKLAQEHLRLAEGAYGLQLKKYGFDYDPSTLEPDEQKNLPTDQNGNTVGFHNPTKQGTALQVAEKSTLDSLNYATQYKQSGHFTGPGDEALMEQFFNVAKPSSGFRMSQPQIDMLINARSWMDSAEGKAYHAATGTWFAAQQRNDIIGTMEALAKSKGVGGQGTPQRGAANPTAPQTQAGPPKFGDFVKSGGR